MLEIGRQGCLQIRVSSVTIRAPRVLPPWRRSAIPWLRVPPSGSSLLRSDRQPLKLDRQSARIWCRRVQLDLQLPTVAATDLPVCALSRVLQPHDQRVQHKSHFKAGRFFCGAVRSGWRQTRRQNLSVQAKMASQHERQAKFWDLSLRKCAACVVK